MTTPPPSPQGMPEVGSGAIAAYRLEREPLPQGTAPPPPPVLAHRLRFAADAGALGLALAAAVVLADGARADGVASGAASGVLSLVLLAGAGSYRPRALQRHSGYAEAARELALALSVAAMATTTLLALAAPASAGAPTTALVWVLGCLFAMAARRLLRRAELRSGTAPKQGVLIVGAGRVGARIERQVRELPELGLEPVGFLDSDPVPSGDLPSRVAPVLGPVGRLDRALRETGATQVILAFSSGSDRALLGAVDTCRAMGVGVSVVPRLFDAATSRLRVDYIGGTPVVRLAAAPRPLAQLVKDVLDRVGAVLAIVLIAPLLVAIAVAVRAGSPGPALFRQRRVGRDAVGFDMLKFRSMRLPSACGEAPCGDQLCLDEPAGPGGVEGDDRRTRLGRFLRATSLDELPQLLNIARGEMSFVGPRPERPQYVELFADCVERYSDRHRMKPGLTGWSQVHGLRGQTSLVRRVEWDNWYIENWSLWLDLEIVLMTFGAIRRGAV